MTTPLENATKAAERAQRLADYAILKALEAHSTVIALTPLDGTSSEVASIAARGLASPESLDHDDIRCVCASALSQAGGATDGG